LQRYSVWVCAGRILSQPDARRSSVIEERVLIMERSFFLEFNTCVGKLVWAVGGWFTWFYIPWAFLAFF
jgi:hypothetical protein